MNIFDREKVNAHLVNMIVEAVLGYKECGKRYVNYNYTLNQCIRQYQGPEENLHMSEGFYDLWKKITSAEVYGSYDEKILCENDNVHISLYKGSKKTPYREGPSVKGETYKWNDLFICEHITTVSDITKKLLALEEVNAETVTEVLETIHLCRLTKEENFAIGKLGGVSSHRKGSYEDIINNVYSKAGIKVI